MPVRTKSAGISEREREGSTTCRDDSNRKVVASIKYSSFTCRTAHIVIKKKSPKGNVYSKVNLVARKRRIMQYSNQKEHEGFVIQKRNRRKVYAVFALIATLLLWITIAGLASSHSSEDGGRSLGR